MRQYIFEKGYPSLSYIAKNWPRTKYLLKKICSFKSKNQIFTFCVLIVLKI